MCLNVLQKIQDLELSTSTRKQQLLQCLSDSFKIKQVIYLRQLDSLQIYMLVQSLAVGDSLGV